MSDTTTRLIDRYNEIAESAGYVIASFGKEIQERDNRIADLESVAYKVIDMEGQEEMTDDLFVDNAINWLSHALPPREVKQDD